jgi:hypothetical protein
MIELSIALGTVGLVAIIAARDVALRYFAAKLVGKRADDVEALAAVVEQNRAELTKRLDDVAVDAAEGARAAREQRLRRVGGGR